MNLAKSQLKYLGRCILKSMLFMILVKLKSEPCQIMLTQTQMNKTCYVQALNLFIKYLKCIQIRSDHNATIFLLLLNDKVRSYHLVVQENYAVFTPKNLT